MMGRSERPPVDSTGNMPRYNPLNVPDMEPLGRIGLVLYECASDQDWSQYLLRLTPGVLATLQENSSKRLMELKSICGCDMAIRVDAHGSTEQRFLVYYRDDMRRSCQNAMTTSLKVLNSWLS